MSQITNKLPPLVDHSLVLMKEIDDLIESGNEKRLASLLYALTRARASSWYACLSEKDVQIFQEKIHVKTKKFLNEMHRNSERSYEKRELSSASSAVSLISREVIYTKLEEQRTITADQRRRINLAIEEAAILLHINERKWSGFGTIGSISKATEKFKAHVFPIRLLEVEITKMICDGDKYDYHVYLSQHSYNGYKRTIQTLMSLNVMTLDLDIYKSNGFDFSDVSINDTVMMVLNRLDFYEVVRPSYIIFSGRGLQLKWIHQPVSISAQNEWQKAQERLLEVFSEDADGEDIFIADKSAILKTQLLRLVGSIHQGSGKEVTIAWVNRDHEHAKSENLNNCKKYEFNQLVASICNYRWTAEEVKEFKNKNSDKFRKMDEENEKNLERLKADKPAYYAFRKRENKNNINNTQVNIAPECTSHFSLQLNRISAKRTWLSRIRMLENLIKIRYKSGRVCDGGKRHVYLWLVANGWAWILQGHVEIQSEIKQRVCVWANQYIDCNSDYINSVIKTVLERSAQDHGQNQGPYFLSNADIFKKLNISREEAEAINNTKLDSKSQQRNENRSRLKKGIMGFTKMIGKEYEDYVVETNLRQSLSASRTNKIQREKYTGNRITALQMYEKGVSINRVAKELGIAPSTVHSYIKKSIVEKIINDDLGKLCITPSCVSKA